MADASSPDPSRPNSFGEAIAAHRERVAEVLPAGDPAEIKQLYIELGELIDQGVDGDDEAVPVLSFPQNLQAIVGLAGDLSGLVLDAGCGPNPAFSIALGRWPARRMVGLDIGLGTVKMAVARSRREGVPFKGVVGDLEDLPFKSGVFDGCVCEDTIEHLPNDQAAAAEIQRVLVRGGRLLLGTPNRIRLDVLVAKLRDRIRGRRVEPTAYYAASSHLREYTWGSLLRLVRPHFRVRRRATVGWSGGPRRRAATALVRFRPFRMVGRMLILDLRAR